MLRYIAVNFELHADFYIHSATTVQFCSKFSSCHFAEKAVSSGSHKVPAIVEFNVPLDTV